MIATAHCAIEPTFGIIPATTWLGRATIDTVKEIVLSCDEDKIDSISTTSHIQLPLSVTNDKQHHHHHHHHDLYDEASSTVKIASAVSGFPPTVCQDILIQFDKIKKKNEENLFSPTTPAKHSKHKLQFRRQRSHSTSDLT